MSQAGSTVTLPGGMVTITARPTAKLRLPKYPGSFRIVDTITRTTYTGAPMRSPQAAAAALTRLMIKRPDADPVVVNNLGEPRSYNSLLAEQAAIVAAALAGQS